VGLANIATGLIYRLPMPIEPMKVLAVMAIAQGWTPKKVYTSALLMGIVWLLMGATGAMTYVARWTPRVVVHGIQLSLGVLLSIEGIKMISSWWFLGLVAIGIVLVVRENRYAPAAIVLVVLGFVVMAINGQLSIIKGPSFRLPPLTMFDSSVSWTVLRDGVLAQIPLTATNKRGDCHVSAHLTVLATAACNRTTTVAEHGRNELDASLFRWDTTVSRG